MRHAQRNRMLRERFARAVGELGQELVPEDLAIAEAFLNSDRHVTEVDLEGLIQDPGIDLSHIRRTLRLLCDLGIAERVNLDGECYYEHLHLDNHHDHLVCVRCGRIIEFLNEEIEAGQARTCKAHGFMPLMHKLEIRGVCRECAGNMPETRSLASCVRGERVEIAEVLGGRGLKHRLLALGLTRGIPVTVLSNDGPVSLNIRGARLALGRNEAAKVIVKQLSSSTASTGGRHEPNPG